ncbi:MAG: transcriptional regulator [Cyanobacteria bacterium P01_A01_bin.123]
MSNLVSLTANQAIVEPPHAMGPLSVLLSPSGQYAVEAGETFEISLTLNNQGTRGAVIDVYIDETSQSFCQWCSNPYERLALEVGQSDEVRFKVTIPVQTLPGTYNYLIVVDAPNHYPEDTPLRYPATVQVLPPVESAVTLNNATFATRPETSSEQPFILSPTTPTEVQVIVHNRSDRVDQFRLEITDLPEAWYQTIYPEGLGELGLIVESDHLALNPSAKGMIRLAIACPATALAGRYLATLRLRSANDRDLVLMDMLYLEVPSRYDLAVSPEAIIRKIKRQSALFHLHITNAGNTAREITLQAQEDQEDPLFTYQIEPLQLRVPAMTTAQATLTANPAERRRRAWFGKGKTVAFRLVVDDHHSLPLPEATTAEVVWERRPWWHLALVILMAAGFVGAIAGVLWWVLIRPPASPKVVDFGSTAPTYYQQRNDFVRLTWQIENPKRIQRLELRSEADQGATAPQPITYDFSDGLPPELADHCVLEKQLNCNNVLTAARQSGSYQFTLTVISKGNQAEPIVAETAEIEILPTPPPEILRFAATQPRYWEALAPSLQESDSDSTAQPSNIVALNWQVTGVDQLSHLVLVGRLSGNDTVLSPPQRYDLSEGLPEELAEFCTLTPTDLTCNALPTSAQTVGAYVFELSLFAPDSDEPIATLETDPIQIVARPIQIETFTVNGEPAPAKFQVQPQAADDAAEDNAAENNVQLAWRVVGGPYTQVELSPTPGSVSLVGELAYPVTANTQEVVTLTVTSVSGETITRSVVLENLQPSFSLPLAPPATVDTMLTIPPPPEVISTPEPPSTSAEELLRPEPSPSRPEIPLPSVPQQPPAKPETPAPTKSELGIQN